MYNKIFKIYFPTIKYSMLNTRMCSKQRLIKITDRTLNVLFVILINLWF